MVDWVGTWGPPRLDNVTTIDLPRGWSAGLLGFLKAKFARSRLSDPK